MYHFKGVALTYNTLLSRTTIKEHLPAPQTLDFLERIENQKINQSKNNTK